VKPRPRAPIAFATAIVAASAALAVAALAAAATGGSTTDAAKATAGFRDLSTAKRAGYALLKDKQGIACIAMDGMQNMAMGIHYARTALVSDGKLNVAKPEALVYAPDGNALRLAAVEYVVLESAWSAHHAGQPVLFGHRFNYTPAGNRFGLPAYYSLHAWIWKHNPSGTFSMWNPEVHCP
jgi:hypothetical protein